MLAAERVDQTVAELSNTYGAERVKVWGGAWCQADLTLNQRCNSMHVLTQKTLSHAFACGKDGNHLPH